MLVILVAALVLTAGSLLLALLVWLGLRLAGRGRAAGDAGLGAPPGRFWKRTRRLHLVLVPTYLFVVIPGAFGWFGSRGVVTRGDEQGFIGPYLDARGAWQAQTRETLRVAASQGGGFVAPDLVEGADGVRVRVFLVPAASPSSPRATVMLVHGLFRGGCEVDAVGAMFHALGAEVCVVELRNHGGSDAAPATYGLRESRDLVCVAEHLRRRPGAASRPLVLYGVSLGACAAALAAPDIGGLSGLVLDAPMAELASTAHRILDVRMGMPQPFRSLTLMAIERWSGFSMADVRPLDALARLPATLPSLVIGGGEDQRMPPAVVRAVHAALPAGPDTKALWIRDGSGHGKVWRDDPGGYGDRLSALLERAVR